MRAILIKVAPIKNCLSLWFSKFAKNWEVLTRDYILHTRSEAFHAGRVGIGALGDDWQLGEVDDGWAESIFSLENFDYKKYGIEVL